MGSFQNETVEAGQNSTITIKQKGPSASSAARSALFFGMKPMVALLGIYALVATAAWGFLLPWGLSLTGQVDRLEAEIDRLGSEVDDLEGQVDRYSEENDRMEKNNEEFGAQNDIFTSSNEVYEDLNDGLNVSVAELTRQNQLLEESNEEYAALNVELLESNEALTVEVDELGVLSTKLTATADEYEKLTDDLSTQVTKLEESNDELGTRVTGLESEVGNLGNENDRLSKLVEDFKKIESFLSEEAANIQQSVDQIAAFLTDQIDANRNLVLQRMATAYRQVTTSFTCGFDLTYRGFSFTSDPNSSLGGTWYPFAVIGPGNEDGYVEETVLTELCLDSDDFEAYLSNFIGGEPNTVTTNELQSGVSRYVDLAMVWYFPYEEEDATTTVTGVGSGDWAEAGYNCENLPQEKQFFWGSRR